MFRFSRFVFITMIGIAFGVGIFTSQYSPTQAAEINQKLVTCRWAILSGSVDLDADFVRVEISLASDLTVSLTSRIVPVINDRYITVLHYTTQPTNTRLILSVGEWDGSGYMQPATLEGVDCRGFGTSPTPTPTYTVTPVTPTLVPVTPSSTPIQPTIPPTFIPSATPIQPTMPPVTPAPSSTPIQPTIPPTFIPSATPIQPTVPPITPAPSSTPLPTAVIPSQAWTVNATLQTDTCGSASDGSTFPVTLVSDPNGVLIALQWFAQYFPMQPAVTHSGYIGGTRGTGGAPLYTLDLFFTSETTFQAYLHVVFELQDNCSWTFEWNGSHGG